MDNLEAIASQTGINEKKYHRNLNICMGLGLLSIPILGPIGICYTAGILVGKGVRKYVRSDTKAAYKAQDLIDKQIEQEKMERERQHYLDSLYSSAQTIKSYIEKSGNLDNINQIDIILSKNNKEIKIK